MRPGPGVPYRGMGANMMGPRFMGSGPRPGPFGGPPMRSFGPAQYQTNPFMGARAPTRQGGLLTKIFGKGSQGAGWQHFQGSANPAGGGLLKSLTNPSSINGFLNNTQQVLKTAQQVGPMIQQYGPLVKNLPAMWKLYRGFKDLPTQTDADTQTETSSANKSTDSIITKGKREPASASIETKKTPTKKVMKESTPKLFY